MYRHPQLGPPHTLGALGVDVLASLNSVETWAKNEVLNALPTWAGGQVLTADQLASIQNQAAQAIHQAATDPITGVTNTALEQQAIAQMQQETAAVAAQAQQQAQNADNPTGVPAWIWWALGATAAVIVVANVL